MVKQSGPGLSPLSFLAYAGAIMITHRHALAGIATVFVFHAFGVYGLYGFWQPYDMPMHFAGGVAMGILALALWDAAIKNVTFTTNRPWVRRLFFTSCVLGFVALVGIGWEWFEFSFDQWVIPTRPDWGLAQMGMADTMSDFFFDLLGGLLVVTLRRKI